MDNLYYDEFKNFWNNIIEQLDAEDRSGESIAKVVREMCGLFGFEYSFVYYSDHRGVFSLAENFVAEMKGSELPKEFDLHERMPYDYLKELCEKKMILTSASGSKEISLLEKQAAALFHTDSLLLLPIIGDKAQIVALIGMVNEKEPEKLQEFEQSLVYSVLVVIANHIRLNLYIQNIERTEKALQSIVDNMGVDIYVNDFKTHEVLYVNRSMAAPYGGVDAMVGNICWQVLYDDKTEQCEYCPQFKLIDSEGNPTKIYSWNYERPFDGSWFRVLSGAFEWVDGRIAHIVSSIDITEDVRNEEMVRALAERDTLTALPNRRKLLLDGEKRIGQKNPGKNLYLMYFDLDKFKQVNDIYGHRGGDDLLGEIGAFLQESALTKDISYRYGGDEFVLLCWDHTLDEVMELAEFLVERFLKKWNLINYQATCNTSIGIVKCPDDGATIRELIDHADAAMYVSKKSEKEKIHFYNDGDICAAGVYLMQRKN